MEIDVKQLAQAVRTIAEEKNLPEDVVKDAVEHALAAAFKRDYGEREQEVRVDMNMHNGDVNAYIVQHIVDEVEDEYTEITLEDAKKRRKDAKVGETIETHHEVKTFGRVAAQTAKQVILQRLREAEREIVLEEFEDKIGTVINGIVSRVEGRLVRFDLGKAQGIMPGSEQIQGEHYHPGQRLKVYLKEVERGPRGPQLIVSRGNTAFVEWLFRGEVPEMENGAVEIKDIAREAGVRTKLSVSSTVQGVDPVGTFVGGHGTRVNAVMSEIGEQEKIDIVVWSDEIKEYIVNALSPTKVTKVELNEEGKHANVVVPEDQLSIAIGRSGQNVRLASKLTKVELDIVSEQKMTDSKDDEAKTNETTNPDAKEGTVESKELPKQPKLKRKDQLEKGLLDAIEEHGE